MKGAEPLVARDPGVSVIAFEVTVVELMEEVTRPDAAVAHRSGRHGLESRMGGDRDQRLLLQVKNEMERMRRHDDVDQDRAQVEGMLDRMHRQPGRPTIRFLLIPRALTIIALLRHTCCSGDGGNRT